MRKLRILADIREKHSGVVHALDGMGCNIELKALPYGDFLCSSRVAVEVKRAPDFINSIVDGRLLSQVKGLAENFERPVLIIEGESEQDLYSIRAVHPNAVRGMLAAVAVSYGLPILHSKNPVDTAGFLVAIASREMDSGYPSPALHAKKPATLQERQEYAIASFPGIETRLARSLLLKFGSVSEVLQASPEQLQEVELIGPKKAAEIKRIVDSEYR